MYEAIAYRRAVWKDVPVRECWDVEQTLGLSGAAVWHPVTRKLVPVYATAFTALDPWRIPDLTDADGNAYDPSVDTLIRVAASTPIRITAEHLLDELEITEIVNVKNARVTLFAKGLENNSGAIDEFIRAINAGTPIPVIKASSEMDIADLVRVGDGSTHMDETQRAYATIMARMCQQLGVHYNDTQKAERLVVDEVEGAYDAVEVVRSNEIQQRRLLAEVTGWTLESIYGKAPEAAAEAAAEETQLTIEEVVENDQNG